MENHCWKRVVALRTIDCEELSLCFVTYLLTYLLGHWSQVFFVIRLQSCSATLQAIRDPDPLVNNDLMDGRDAFLMMAREKHYEFSTLRRAKFSSMAMLYELHTQGRDSFVYTCNSCKANMETHYHCVTCDVRLLHYSLLSCCYCYFQGLNRPGRNRFLPGFLPRVFEPA